MTSEKHAAALGTAFNRVSGQSGVGRPPAPPSPFCLRLSVEERAHLEAQAGNRPLGAYIREQLLGDRARKRRACRRPRADEQAIAQLLAGLKSSRLSPNLNQLAKAANCGNLPLAEDIERQLTEACQAVLAMRSALFFALGLRPEGE